MSPSFSYSSRILFSDSSSLLVFFFLLREQVSLKLQPRKSQWIQNQLTTSMMSEMGKLKRNQVPKFTTSAAGYWLLKCSKKMRLVEVPMMVVRPPMVAA